MDDLAMTDAPTEIPVENSIQIPAEATTATPNTPNDTTAVARRPRLNSPIIRDMRDPHYQPPAQQTPNEFLKEHVPHRNPP